MCPADKSSAVSNLKKNHHGRKRGEGQSEAGERLSPGAGPKIRGAICLVIATALISWSKHTEETPPACGSDRAEETRYLQSCVFLLSPKMEEITARANKKFIWAIKCALDGNLMLPTSPSSEGDIKFLQLGHLFSVSVPLLEWQKHLGTWSRWREGRSPCTEPTGWVSHSLPVWAASLWEDGREWDEAV